MAAVDLIEQAMAWERVAAWVESQRLDTLRRFEAARVAADTFLADGPVLEDDTEAPADRLPGERAALRRYKAHLATEAGRFAAEEIALALNIPPRPRTGSCTSPATCTRCTAICAKPSSSARSAASSRR